LFDANKVSQRFAGNCDGRHTRPGGTNPGVNPSRPGRDAPVEAEVNGQIDGMVLASSSFMERQLFRDDTALAQKDTNR
jgi:hypothetical protein